MQEKIIILDFGSQTTQLIGRRLRELNVYCEIVPYNKFPYGDESVKGVILSGSPFSVYDKSAFKVDLSGIRGKYPILGICYGAQFISYSNGGRVEPAGTREYGRAHLGSFDSENVLFKGVRKNTQVWMSHGDTIRAIPDNFKIIASTDKVAIAAYQVSGEEMWGVQFHPEVFHSEDGTQMLRNFVVDDVAEEVAKFDEEQQKVFILCAIKSLLNHISEGARALNNEWWWSAVPRRSVKSINLRDYNSLFLIYRLRQLLYIWSNVGMRRCTQE